MYVCVCGRGLEFRTRGSCCLGGQRAAYSVCVTFSWQAVISLQWFHLSSLTQEPCSIPLCHTGVINNEETEREREPERRMQGEKKNTDFLAIYTFAFMFENRCM